MRFPVTTLRPDKYGKTNVTRSVIHGIEYREMPIENSATTSSKHFTRGGLPERAREKLSEGGQGVPKDGPIVLPFLRHLFGRNQGAFCGDSSVLPVVGAKEIAVGTAVCVTGCDSNLNIPSVDKASVAYADANKRVMLEEGGLGIVQSVIEDTGRRTYLGLNEAETDIYLFQYFGLARALVKASPVPAVRAKLYLETNTDTIGLTTTDTGYFIGINLGKAIPVDEGYTSNLIFIMQTSGINAKGDKVLNKGVFLREYDENGVIVAPGSEINPALYATQAAYEAALTAAKHTLKPTWDWPRKGADITP